MRLQEQITTNPRNWRYYPHPISYSKKKKIARGLIKNGYVKVKHKIIKNPNLKVDNKEWISKDNLDYSYSLINSYLFYTKEWRRPFFEDDKIIIRPPRRTSTYKQKLLIKKTYNKDLKTLDYIIFKAGWANSLDHARHLIRQGLIEVNGFVIKKYKYECKKGSIIFNKDKSSIFHYYKQKYHATFINRRGERRYTRYPFSEQGNNITKLNFNKILYS